MKKKHFIILGDGYTANHLNRLLTPLNYTIYHTSRKIPTNTLQTNHNKQVIHFEHTDLCTYLKTASAILSTIPPNPDGTDPVLVRYTDTLIESDCPWIAYISSTGVYGDHQGGWVDESSACQPSDAVNLRRLKVEQAWLNLYKKHHCPVHIFRAAGIYGPKRNALQDLNQGKSFTVYEPKHFFSRIHVEDLCQALLTSIQNKSPGEIYNLADDKPAPQHLVHQFAAHLLQCPPPPLLTLKDAPLSERAREFFNANKKINNQKIKNKLHFNFKYPSYQEGLQQLLTETVNDLMKK